jgi:hypothetical protein
MPLTLPASAELLQITTHPFAHLPHSPYAFYRQPRKQSPISSMGYFQSALAPFTVKGFYLLTWGTALGSNVWNTAVSAARNLVPLHLSRSASYLGHLVHLVGLISLPHSPLTPGRVQDVQVPPALDVRHPPNPPHALLLRLPDPHDLDPPAHPPLLPPGPDLVPAG